MSMVGRKIFGQVDKRLCQIFPHNSQHICLVAAHVFYLVTLDSYLQLWICHYTLLHLEISYQIWAVPPITALTLLLLLIRLCINMVMMLFRNILLRLRNGNTSLNDWEHLMSRTPSKIDNLSTFEYALCLFPTVQAVAEYNLMKLKDINRPIATIKAVHNGSKCS